MFSTTVPPPPARATWRASASMPVESALIASLRIPSSILYLPVSFTLVVELVIFSAWAARGSTPTRPPLLPSAWLVVFRLLPAWISSFSAARVPSAIFTLILLVAEVVEILVPVAIAPVTVPLAWDMAVELSWAVIFRVPPLSTTSSWPLPFWIR